MKKTTFGGWLAVAAAIAIAGPASGGTLPTTKGDRFDVGPSAVPQHVDVGDRLAISCPMAKERAVVTIRDIDSKGRVTVRSEGVGRSMPGCKIALRRGASSKETGLAMVCQTHACAVKCQRVN